MGLLDEVATAVAKRGSEIVDLLKSGRADEVTDAMLDMGDPVLNTRLNEYLWNNYDLPMDAVSRAERAKKYPTQDMYSGTGEDFPAFNDAAIYATNNPDLAYTYAPSDGGNIMPLVMRAKHGSPVVNAGGANWNRLTPSMREGGPQEPYLPGILRDPADIAKHGEDILTTRDFEQAAKEQGFSGVTFNDIVDVGGYFSKYFPEGPARDAQRASMKAASEPSRVETRFYPNQVRSRFARFDPRLAHLKNLNAGVAGATAAGAGLLADDNEANAATTAPLRADVTGAGEYSLGYADRLGQLYRVDGGLMTPVGVSTEGITATPDRMEAPPEAQPEPWAIDEALRYYLGPTGIPERLAAVNEMLNPVRGMERAGEASNRMLDPNLGGLERTAAGADMLTEMLGAMLGFGGTKQAVQEAAPAVERGVLDIIDRLNQPGAMPTTYSNPIPGLLADDVAAPSINRLDPDAWKTRILSSIPKSWLDKKYTQPQWHGISNVAANLPPEKMRPVVSSTNTLVPEQPMQIEDLVRLFRSATPAYGDRTIAGVNIEGVGDLTYQDIVRSLGGADFMREMNTGLWANAGPQAQQLADTLLASLKRGEDPALIFTAMGPQSGDFSTMMARSVMNQYDPARIANVPQELIDRYDAAVRAAVPKFRGIKDPNFLEGLKGTDRWNLWQLMDRADYRDAGFPDINLARRSITDERLLDAVPFDTGLTVGKPTGYLLDDAASYTPHPTYPAQLGGEYAGGLGNIPGPLIWRDFFDARRAAGKSPAGDQKSFMGSAGLMRQRLDQQTVDEVRQFMELLQNLSDPTSPFRLWQR